MITASVSIASFLERCVAYCKSTGTPETTLSYWLFQDTRWIGRLKGGSDSGVQRLLRAQARLGELEARIAAESAPMHRPRRQPARPALGATIAATRIRRAKGNA